MPVLLMLVLSFALSCGIAMVVLLSRRAHSRPLGIHLSRRHDEGIDCTSFVPAHSTGLISRPSSWLEGLAGEEKLFIAPPIKGWIIVLGSGLPEPNHDVDACFCFLLEMSRKLGRIQFFNASRILHHHAWIQAEHGRIIRAYAWAGRTLWNQGKTTLGERELGLKCFDYSD